MSVLTLERLRSEGQAFMEEISREGYLAYSGHKQTAELQPIYRKYERIMTRDALELTVDAFESASEASEEKRSAR